MRVRVLALALLALFLLVAGGGAADARKPHSSERVRLKAFSDCRALVRYGKRHVKRPRGPIGIPIDGVPAGGAPQQSGPQPEAPASGEGSSGTNVQEAGIDEPDVVKSRGSVIFAVRWGGGLNAVDTADGEPRLVDALDLRGWNHQLLLHGDRLLAIGESERGTLLTEVDVSDPGDMRIVRTQDVDGFFVSARMNGPTARVVISSYPAAAYAPKLRNRAAGWRPSSVLRKAGRGRGKRKPLLSCHKVRRAQTFSGMEMLTVLTIDMPKGLPAVDSDAILSNGELVYASAENLYVATQRVVREADSKDEEPPALSTLIHKFAASERGETGYVASGKVRGTLLNQWSMSDHDGALRVASTDTPPWWDGDPDEDSQSFVTVLKERPGALEQVGRVGGLGRGERIYAVRFIGDVGYVVTFRQVDPLYTLDLADPADPRVAGELKIRGYSAYLHPVGDGLLLGVGQDATDEGRALGVQLSLFDVSDPAKPVRLHHRKLGSGSWSEVDYDHHAFLWWGPEKLAVIPFASYGEDGNDYSTGAIGYHVDREDGIEEAGRASHDDQGRKGEWLDHIVRSLVVDGRLFTLSESGLELNSMDTLAELAWLPFDGS
jgi:uncharacterized secreted protein with C-terminal beta-propeller domain